jgi:hypothetical protein
MSFSVLSNIATLHNLLSAMSFDNDRKLINVKAFWIEWVSCL